MYNYETKSTNHLLMQIALTGALYGLMDAVDTICTYTDKVDNLVAPSMLARGIARVSVKRYDEAIQIFDCIIQEPEFQKWHEDAYGFKALAHQFKGDKSLAKQSIAMASPIFAQAMVM